MGRSPKHSEGCGGLGWEGGMENVLCDVEKYTSPQNWQAGTVPLKSVSGKNIQPPQNIPNRKGQIGEIRVFFVKLQS